MSIYSEKFTLANKDVDLYRRLRTSRLFEMLQAVSVTHTEQLGAGRQQTLDHGILWVVIQQSIQIQRMPAYEETITIETWPGRTMHVLFPSLL
jgi:acyl-ACP thioesterase